MKNAYTITFKNLTPKMEIGTQKLSKTSEQVQTKSKRRTTREYSPNTTTWD